MIDILGRSPIGIFLFSSLAKKRFLHMLTISKGISRLRPDTKILARGRSHADYLFRGSPQDGWWTQERIVWWKMVSMTKGKRLEDESFSPLSASLVLDCTVQASGQGEGPSIFVCVHPQTPTPSVFLTSHRGQKKVVCRIFALFKGTAAR
jgi:hypothetical protein